MAAAPARREAAEARGNAHVLVVPVASKGKGLDVAAMFSGTPSVRIRFLLALTNRMAIGGWRAIDEAVKLLLANAVRRHELHKRERLKRDERADKGMPALRATIAELPRVDERVLKVAAVAQREEGVVVRVSASR